jgi:hypothetical protein
MNEIKKEWTKDEIKHLLETRDLMVERSIVQVYYKQTEDEKMAKDTNHQNGVGFNHVDSQLLSSFAEQIIKGRHLTQKQMVYARKKIMKYANQIKKIANGEI